MSKRIIYSRGFPYGAPLVMLRGGGTKDEEVKRFLKEAAGFRWNSERYAWETYMDRQDLGGVLLSLQRMGCEILPKEGMDESYLLDLESPTFSRPA